MAKKKTVKTAPVKSLAEVIVDLELEFDEIAGRVEKIDASLDDDDFCDRIGIEHTNLLIQQRNAMLEYRDKLGIRLALLRRANAKAVEAEIKEKAVKA
jgi:hypothetical protein